jgi:hypothetical protein
VEGVTTIGDAAPRPQRKPRRQRSIQESLLSIALVLEAVLIFFVTLTAFGLKALPPVTAFVGGAAFFLALVAASALQRFEWGVWIGWVLQVALLATGFILPLMFFVGAIFVALWIFCFVKARQLTDQRQSAEPTSTEETP